MFRPPCPKCVNGLLVNGVTFTLSGSEIPLVTCDTCDFQADADDFKPNASYCVECSARGALGEMKYDPFDRVNTCDICGETEEVEHLDSCISLSI